MFKWSVRTLHYIRTLSVFPILKARRLEDVSTTKQLPSNTRRTCAPLMTDWKPEPQSRLTVSAGTGMGMPTLRAA